jgi:hypothetical protein
MIYLLDDFEVLYLTVIFLFVLLFYVPRPHRVQLLVLLFMSTTGKRKGKHTSHGAFRISRPYLDDDDTTPLTNTSSFHRQAGRVTQQMSTLETPFDAMPEDDEDPEEDAPWHAGFFKDLPLPDMEVLVDQGGEANDPEPEVTPQVVIVSRCNGWPFHDLSHHLIGQGYACAGMGASSTNIFGGVVAS